MNFLAGKTLTAAFGAKLQPSTSASSSGASRVAADTLEHQDTSRKIGVDEKLPPELLLSIAMAVDDRKTLASLSLVSRRWNTVVVPFLFRRITVVAPPKFRPFWARQRSSSSRVQSLSAFRAFLENSPAIRAHIKEIKLHVVMPEHESPNSRVVDRRYAIAPEDILGIFCHLPSLEKAYLVNVFFLRPLESIERNRVSGIDTVRFWSPGLQGASGLPVHPMEVTDMFSGSSTSSVFVHDMDDIEVPLNALDGSSGLNPEREGFLQCRRPVISGARNLLMIVLRLRPSPATLEVLMMNGYWGSIQRTVYELLKQAPYGACLKHLQCTFIHSHNDIPAQESFELISRCKLPNLRKLALGLQWQAVYPEESNSLRMWNYINWTLQVLTPKKYPLLRSVVIFKEVLEDTDKFTLPNFPPQFFEASDRALAKLAEEGKFEQLVFCLAGMMASKPCLAVNNYSNIKALFPRVYAKGLLLVPETREAAAAILYRHEFKFSSVPHKGTYISEDPDETS